MAPEHELIRTSEAIVRRLAWRAHREATSSTRARAGSMDRTTPAYRQWRRQAAGHAYLVAQLRSLHPYPRRWQAGSPEAPALERMTSAMFESMPMP